MWLFVIVPGYERNHNKLHRRHSPGTSSLEDLFRPDDTTDGNKVSFKL